MNQIRHARLARHFGVAAFAIVTAPLLLAERASTTQRTFPSPETAVRALTEAVKAGKLDEVIAIFGPDGADLIDSSDAATARHNREVFAAATAEGWRLVDDAPNRKSLVIGNEGWPFPVPLVKDGTTWRFDTAAGKEEVLARRIGRNELAVIGVCREYVAAQRHYAQDAHDGKRAGLYASTFRSDPGRHNGLFWRAARGQKPSPLGDLVAQAQQEGRVAAGSPAPTPFHGYYFKIVTAQGANAPGGAKSYVVNGELSGGFALVAWPAQYDQTGVMTFMVNQDGVVFQKDLGPDSAKLARAMTAYNPDLAWAAVPHGVETDK